MSFELTAHARDSLLVISLRGQLDAADAASAMTAVTDLPVRGRSVVIELAALDFIDCFALNALLEMRLAVRLAGGDVLLAAPHERVQRLLALTGMDRTFAVYRTVAEAAAAGGAYARQAGA